MNAVDWFQQGQQFRLSPHTACLPPPDAVSEQQQWLQGVAQAHQKETELLLLCDCDPQGSDFEISLPVQPLTAFLQQQLPMQTVLAAQLLRLCQQLQL